MGYIVYLKRAHAHDDDAISVLSFALAALRRTNAVVYSELTHAISDYNSKKNEQNLYVTFYFLIHKILLIYRVRKFNRQTFRDCREHQKY